MSQVFHEFRKIRIAPIRLRQQHSAVFNVLP